MLRQYGFSFIEIMVVVAIVLALAGIAVVSLSALNDRLLLRSATSDILFRLEEAKARSVSGQGGVPHGIHFSEDSYAEFRGEDFNPSGSGVVTHVLDGRLQLTTDILGHEASLVFARISGAVNEPVTITISIRSDPTKQRHIIVGAGGDVAYLE